MINCRASRVWLFAESTWFYGNYMVMIEQCTLDPKIIWRINYNDSKSTFFCKDNCTIKGLELDGVLEEKPHGHFLSWRAEPPFVEQEAHPTEHSFHLSANGCSAEIFPRQPPNILEILVSLVSAIPKDPRLRPGLALFCTCKQTIINCKCWVCPSITCSVHLLPQDSS